MQWDALITVFGSIKVPPHKLQSSPLIHIVIKTCAGQLWAVALDPLLLIFFKTNSSN